MVRKLVLAAASLILLGSGTAMALTPTAAANYGEVALTAGFTPDPHAVPLLAGGAVDATTQGLPAACRGFVTDAPDYRLNYTSGAYTLEISVRSSVEVDTTLIINDPIGNWICDDDGGGNLNPLVTFNNPLSGRYDIWVGTFSAGGTQPATLNIHEIFAGAGGGGGGGGGATIDPFLPANFGEVTLAAGFTPDPHTVPLQAGGTIDAQAGVPGGACSGFVTAAPDYKLNYTPGAYTLEISVLSSVDTTLIINDPNGNWICDDDGGGNLNPLVTINNPASGRYDIWVGTFSAGGTQPATLNIHEIFAGGGGGGAALMPNPGLSPTFGTVTLQAGVPHQVNLQAGGTIDATVLGGNCRGFIAQAPDYRVNFQTLAGILPLIFNVTSTVDTTLVVNDPNGNWICDDDGGGNLDPMIRINGPGPGQYDIWVGVYGAAGAQPATLRISTMLP